MGLRRHRSGWAGALLLASALAPALAQAQASPRPVAVETPGAGEVQPAARGPVTDLPLPRYVSLRAGEANVRRGPSLGHRIDWVYQRRDLPLRITAEYGHWRRVVDRDGQGGWVHYALLSGVRTAMVEAESVTLTSTPRPSGQEVARVMRGVVLRVEECTADWCRVRADGHRGWLRKGDIWGVDPDEIVE